jgi:hypothetical protein
VVRITGEPSRGAILGGERELVTLSGVKHKSSATLCDHLTGHAEVEVPMPQSVNNLGDDASQRAVDGSEPPVFAVGSFCAHGVLCRMPTASMTGVAALYLTPDAGPRGLMSVHAHAVNSACNRPVTHLSNSLLHPQAAEGGAAALAC